MYVCFFLNNISAQAWFACQRYIWVRRWGFGSHTFSHDFLTELLVVDFRWPCSLSCFSPPTSCNENAEENGTERKYSWRQCCRTVFSFVLWAVPTSYSFLVTQTTEAVPRCSSSGGIVGFKNVFQASPNLIKRGESEKSKSSQYHIGNKAEEPLNWLWLF